MPCSIVEAATLNQHGPPPFARYPVSTCCAPYPGRLLWVHLSAASPNHAAFPVFRPGRRPRLSLSRPAQASHMLRPVDSLGRPGRPLSQGFDPANYSTKPPASYRANRPLPDGTSTHKATAPHRGAPEQTKWVWGLRPQRVQGRALAFTFRIKPSASCCQSSDFLMFALMGLCPLCH